MANISQIEVGGTTYDVCDATARDLISSTYSFQSDTGTAVSVSAGGTVQSGSLTLGPGVWIIKFSIYFSGFATGKAARGVLGTTSDAAPTLNQRWGIQIPSPGTGSYYSPAQVMLAHPTSTTTYYSWLYNGDTAAHNMRADLWAVRIFPE